MSPARLNQRCFTIAIPCLIAGGLLLVLGILIWNPLLMVGGNVLVMFANGVCLVSVWRLRRLVNAYGPDLCLNCGYPMRGLEDQDVCPECGCTHNRAEAIKRISKRAGFGPNAPRQSRPADSRDAHENLGDAGGDRV